MTLDAALALRERADHARLDAMTDEDIQRQIAQDPDVTPEWTDEMFARARVVPPVVAAPGLLVDEDVVRWFRTVDKNYQKRMNAVLRAYMNRHREPAPRAKRSARG